MLICSVDRKKKKLKKMDKLIWVSQERKEKRERETWNGEFFFIPLMAEIFWCMMDQLLNVAPFTGEDLNPNFLDLRSRKQFGAPSGIYSFEFHFCRSIKICCVSPLWVRELWASDSMKARVWILRKYLRN